MALWWRTPCALAEIVCLRKPKYDPSPPNVTQHYRVILEHSKLYMLVSQGSDEASELKLRKKGLLLAEIHFQTKVILLQTPRNVVFNMTNKTAVSVSLSPQPRR